jgi:hypothetical protein
MKSMHFCHEVSQHQFFNLTLAGQNSWVSQFKSSLFFQSQDKRDDPHADCFTVRKTEENLKSNMWPQGIPQKFIRKIFGGKNHGRLKCRVRWENELVHYSFGQLGGDWMGDALVSFGIAHVVFVRDGGLDNKGSHVFSNNALKQIFLVVGDETWLKMLWQKRASNDPS